MRVLYSEGVATHTGPEPCVLSREGQDEASAGDRAGWPSSHERAFSRVLTRLPTRKATRPAASTRAAGRPGVVKDPSMHGRSLSGNREVSSPADGVARRRSVRERPKGRSPQ